ncbi:MAG: RluA family pseudouridine synthase [Clostridium sp.]|jgi:23S rRNA pseudouridine955/2504/2580 synthase|nr:RluA family pseudouridine synthase [Clostridium sp.]
MQSLTIGANQAGQRFDRFLHKYLSEAPNGFLYKMLRKKNITLNGKKAQGKEILVQGDEVCLYLSEETLQTFGPCSPGLPLAHAKMSRKAQTSAEARISAIRQDLSARIVYEDEHVLIVNKPSGLLTQKAVRADYSLNDWLLDYLLEARDPAGRPMLDPAELRTFRPSVCNRLDRNTGGLVLCGKTLTGNQELSRLLRERAVRKFYRAMVAGYLDTPCDMEAYLVKDQWKNKVQIHQAQTCPEQTFTVQTDPDQTRTEPDDPAQTHSAQVRPAQTRPIQFRNALQSPEPSGQDGSAYIHTAYQPLRMGKGLTYLEVELFTGKPHQIRAHLAAIGHPVIGDYKYGDSEQNELYRTRRHVTSQLLHAYRMEFPELSGALSGLSKKTVLAPLPAALRKLAAELSVS